MNEMDARPAATLPVKDNLAPIYFSSILAAVLLGLVSAASFVYRERVYPTEELLQALAPNDVVNFCMGLPILLGSLWFARRDRLVGLLFWIGALAFVLYNSLAYIFALPFGRAFLLHLLLVVTSAYTLIGLFAAVEAESVRLNNFLVYLFFFAGMIFLFGRIMLATIRALRLPSIRFDRRARLMQVGRGQHARRIPFSQIAWISAERVKQRGAKARSVEMIQIDVGLESGETVQIGSLSGAREDVIDRAESIAFHMSEMTSAPLAP